MTIPLYLGDTYLFSSEAQILRYGKDEKGSFIILDQTIFYPQGGGQPSDHGILQQGTHKINIILVRQVENEIRHYITSSSHDVALNDRVMCFLDKNARIWNSRYHTAGHLLGNTIELAYPMLKAIKGHSFPGEAYVEFQGDANIDIRYIQNSIDEIIICNDKIRTLETDSISFESLFYKLPYPIPKEKKFRAIQIGNMAPVPCGGTHLRSVAEIGHIVVDKAKLKNNRLRVSYKVI